MSIIIQKHWDFITAGLSAVVAGMLYRNLPVWLHPIDHWWGIVLVLGAVAFGYLATAVANGFYANVRRFGLEQAIEESGVENLMNAFLAPMKWGNYALFALGGYVASHFILGHGNWATIACSLGTWICTITSSISSMRALKLLTGMARIAITLDAVVDQMDEDETDEESQGEEL